MSFNKDVARKLERISQLQELLGENRFKVAANAKAARTIEGHATDLSGLSKKELVAIEGIGDKIADKIVECAQTGSIGELEELARKVPSTLVELLEVQGLGPKTVRLVWEEKGITTLAELKAAIADGSLEDLPRMGKRSVEKIGEALGLYEEGTRRMNIGPAMAIARHLVEELGAHKAVKKIAYAGSLRRGKETIGDIDLLVATDDPEAVSEAFKKNKLVTKVIASGKTKTSVRIGLGRATEALIEGRTVTEKDVGEGGGGRSVQVDLRVVEEKGWGAGLLYFTGSKAHNVRLRERAIKRGMTLNEYGLFPDDKEAGGEGGSPQSRGVKPVAGKTEEEIYEALGLPWLPAEVREDSGELGLEETPELIEVGDIKAELHAHTVDSDGAMSLEELVGEAKRRKFHTIAVTDHSKMSAVANGLDEKRLAEQIKRVRAYNEEVKGITVLTGSEVDIHADGRLDFGDETLAELDVVVASPHFAISQDTKAATRRLIRAIENPYVHILGHPTGRLINRRAGLSPAMDEVIAAAVEHDVALEINAHWMRLDLRDTHVRAAVEAGAKIAIDCDVHTKGDYANLVFGVLTGRRGWLSAEQCVNTWGKERLHGWLKSKR